MNELKFRAWHKRYELLKPVERLFLNENKIQVDGSYIGDKHEWFMDECELMQYTGLKDKKGKEIYERDIVKSKIKPREQEHIGVITWDDEEIVGYRVVFSKSGIKYRHYFCGWYEYEIIGNLYENPELLEK